MIKSFSDMMLVPFAKYLSKYAVDWKISSVGTSMMIPKENLDFNSLIFKRKRLSFSADNSWDFIASVIIVDSSDFDETLHSDVFRSLKGLECVMVQKGIFKKKRLMINNPILKYLKDKAFRELVISPELADAINDHEAIQENFSQCKPDNVSIQLYSQSIKSKNIDEYCKQYKQHLEDPDKIIWNISIEKFLDTIVTRKTYLNTLDSLINALDLISRILRQFSTTITSQ